MRMVATFFVAVLLLTLVATSFTAIHILFYIHKVSIQTQPSLDHHGILILFFLSRQ